MELMVLDEHGRDVVRKRAETADEAARLAREADVLTRAAGVPGIPVLLRHDVCLDAMSTGAFLATLTTVAAEGPSLMLADPLPPEMIARVSLGLARTLAALHERAIVHGALIPSHVVLDGDDAPVLCGLAAAGAAGDSSPDEAGRTLQTEDDVAAWGDLVAHLLDYEAVSGFPNAGQPIRDELAARADDARHPDPRRRPSARGIAVTLEHRLGGEVGTSAAGGPGGVAGTVRRERWRMVKGLRRSGVPLAAGHWPRAFGVAAAALVILMAVPAVAGLLKPQRPTLGPVSALAEQCPPVTGQAADVDGDGCEEPVRWADGVIQAGVARFSLGAAGDHVVVGDWDCDGRRTPALLAAGEVVVFDAWADPGGDLAGRSVANVVGATGLAGVRGADGCDRLNVSRASAADLLVEVRP